MENSKAIIHSAEDDQVIRRTICKNLTNDEYHLFKEVCKHTQLNPVFRQIHPVKRGDAMTIQTGIDGYRLIADRTGKYMPGKEYSFAYKDGKNIFSATATVKKLGPDNQWHEVSHTVYWDEYVPYTRDGKLMGQWGKMGHVMLGKCAEAAALRKAFPADLSGVYTKEEMEQDGEHTISIAPITQAPSAQTENPEVQEDSLIGQPEEPPLELLDAEQIAELESIIHPMDYEYKTKMFVWVAGKCLKVIEGFSDIPKKYFATCIVSANKRRDELSKQNMNQEKFKHAPIHENIEKENPLI